MKIKRRNIIAADLNNEEAAKFEDWATKNNLNMNQAVKKCINLTIDNFRFLQEMRP